MTDKTRPPIAETIAFLGTGRMATALGKGVIESRAVSASQVSGFDISPDARAAFAKATGGKAVESVSALLGADVIVLSVKPQQMGAALSELTGRISPETLVITIAAGLPISFYTKVLGADVRFVRVMPNTPALVGAGASAYALGESARSADGELARRILETVGLAVMVPESLLDAVTGLSGGGPAYGYQIIEALSDGGVQAGLPRATATKLAAQTLMGAARMVLETGEHPGALKDAVTSPGGTTIAGIAELERGGLRASLMNAVVAATRRSRELGEG